MSTQFEVFFQKKCFRGVTSLYQELIKSWREYFGYSQETLADVCKTTRITVGRWEKGKTTPNNEMIRRIANSLGIDYQDFLAGPEEYEKRRREREETQHPQITPLDLKSMSSIYMLSGMGPSRSRSFILGYSPVLSSEEDPVGIIEVAVDLEGELVPRGEVARVNTNESPRLGDIVLVWDGDQCRFVRWKQDSSEEDYETVYGPVVGRRGI